MKLTILNYSDAMVIAEIDVKRVPQRKEKISLTRSISNVTTIYTVKEVNTKLDMSPHFDLTPSKKECYEIFVTEIPL